MRRTEFLTEKREFDHLTAKLLMEKNVVSCRPTDNGRAIATELTKSNFGSLPVLDEKGGLVGIISEFDLLKVLMEGRKLEEIKVQEIMTRKVKTVEEDTLVKEIIRLLDADHLIRVPVVRGGKLVGIVARRDVLFGYIKATAEYWP
jgi:CBS domain-containing protein